MVKNKVGGNRSKKVARKNVNDSSSFSRKLRFTENEDEIYGIVTKIIGNGQVQIIGCDNKERLCFIRYKFSGRNKQSNLVTLGSWVIVGNRSWETVIEGKLPKCDLLEIYTNQEKNRLIQECKTNLLVLLKEEQKQMNLDESQNTDDIVFSNNNGINESSFMTGISEASENDLCENKDNFEINFDEI